jgi:uncharacterized membrane protein
MASTAPASRVETYPVHQFLGAFPLGLFVAAFVTDVAYANTANIQWANFSAWLIAGALVFAYAAAVVGIVDALRHRGKVRPRRLPWWHGVATLLVLVLGTLNAFVHSRDAWTSVVPTGIALSGVVALLVIVTSFTGYALIGREVR